MPQEFSRERLADLLVDPREDLNLEVKNWLGLQNSNNDKATFAKAAIAISNHGGGFIILGLSDENMLEADGRPPTLDGYNQDLINGIIQYYSDPPFHCEVHFVSNPDDAIFPIVVIPGGHKVPIRARRSGPNGNILADNAIYIRKPGPRSEMPQSAQDWDDLLGRCLRNRRDEMYDQIRDLITGAVPQLQQPTEPDKLEEWIDKSFERWSDLTEPLPANVGARFTHGFYRIAYKIEGQNRQLDTAEIPEVLRNSVVHHTGWPPFWYPLRRGIAPYLIDGAVECWLGSDDEAPIEQRDAAHSDFWRIHPEGLAFLLRGFQEDGMEDQRAIPVGTAFDLTLPVWRVGETLLHASSLAAGLFEGPTAIRFVVTYEGLAGRSLISVGNRRNIREGRVAQQNSITLTTHIDAQAIDTNLPEIVRPLLSPLYALFDFFELPMQLVVDELARMRGGGS
ncbi:MAG: hypothetical protein CMN55_12600 [Sneathiella sp.]|jgi:hypothetical protein|uniref:AlbA family DNA-binding domain-containing protein n=1 Tax=Sneathiella sp. TaxID=1964365 RepID=UPI000C5218F0|nr:RNA-binding domain-containing protein [Sneathiella sp.]MAL79931.1 hypothetical protein [Sneathiella sp.]|tara:strand:+ start:272 stop:1624 length:1353 start_codon:yes stop_codon:yes gene_type:complete